jgi:hypothetical protein
MKQIVLNGTRFPILKDGDITQYGRDLEVTFGKGGDIDWTAGLGHGYTYSDGFDASLAYLRLSPHRITLAIPEYTEKHAGLFETPKPASAVTDMYVASAKVIGETANLTVSLNSGTGPDRMIVINVSVDTLATTDYDNPAADYPTYGGVRAALREVSSTGSPGYMIFYVPNALSGANDIVYPNSGLKDVVVTAVALQNVFQVDPFASVNETTGTSLAPSATAAGFTLTVGGVAYALRGTDDPTITASGANHTLRQSDQQEGAGADVGGAISTRPGTEDGVMLYALSAGADVAWKAWAVPILQASNNTFIYSHEDEYIHKHTISSTALVEGAIAEVTDPVKPAAGTAEYAGRAFQWLGEWQVPAGGSAFVQRLATIGATSDTWTANDWYCVEATEFQDGATPEIAAGYYGDGGTIGTPAANRLATSADTALPITASSFTEHSLIRDKGLDINAVCETGGFVLIAKEDVASEVDRDQVARPVIPPLSKGNTDQENGKYATMWGDIWVIPMQSALWGYLVGRDAFKMGVESLIEAGLLPRVANSGVANILDRRPYSPVLAGASVYFCQATSTTTGATIYLRKRRAYDPPGGDFLMHMLWDGDRWKGGMWDSQARMIMKEATSIPADRGLTSFHTGADGSPNTATRRGDVGTAHKIIFPPITPTPYRTTQLRVFEIVTANTWDATTSLQVGAYRDEDDSVDAIGSAITSAGVSYLVPTIGTSDTGERWVFELILTTSSGGTPYLPLTFDPHILRARAVFRTMQITRYTIPASNKLLAELGGELNYNTARKLLQGMMNQGPVTVSPPDQYGTGMLQGVNHSGEVVRVDERGDGEARVFDCYVGRFVQD